jgi:aminopeptidase YwaD
MPSTGPFRRRTRPTLRAALLLPLLLAVPVGLRAQAAGAELLDPRVRDLLHEALSGEIAKDHVIQITRHHRIQGSRGYRDAAHYVLEELRRAGFGEADAYIESFPSDGRIRYQTWQSPSGWHIESAELRMLEPFEERIVGYPEIAMSVMTYSNAGHAVGELVWVGAGTSDADYEGKDVRDRLVLCTGYGGAVHRLAVLKYGARAVICYLDDERAMHFPDMLQYTGMWPRTEELERTTFGFNLTKRQGERLRRLVESGQRVVLDARVEGPGLEPYFMDVVVAHVRGGARAAEELVLTAHLDHPKESANDNASGSGALLDMAPALKRLIDAGRLPRPDRSIRFLWVPEYYGTMAYVDAHPEMVGPAMGGRFLANINMDMVGEHLELLHSKMILTRTPASIPSVLNDVVENMAQMVDGMDIRTPRGSQSAFNYRVTPYSGGSDHNMFIALKIPGVMINHYPDYTHHTSEDTPDKVDPVQLERSQVLAAGAFLYLASLTPAQAADLAYLTAANGAARLGRAGRSAMAAVRGAEAPAAGGAWAEAQNALDHALAWELETLRSVLHFQDAEPARRAVAEREPQLHAQHASLSQGLRGAANAAGARGARPPAPGEADRRVPRRLTRGPLASDLPLSALPPERAAWYGTPEARRLPGNLRFELVNFVDGARTVTGIRDALSAQFGPVPTAVVARYLEDLVHAEVVEWRR